MAGTTPQEEFADALERLGNGNASLMARIADIKTVSAPHAESDLTAFVDQEVRKFARITKQIAANIEMVSDKQSDAATPLREFMLDNGITRPAKKPNFLKTILTLQSVFVVETAATAGLLASDGAMDLLPALLTGAAFAGTNIVLGAATGYFFLRGMTHRIDAPEPKPRDSFIRRLSAGVSLGSIAVMTVLHFSASRVRIMGEHAGLWDFDKAPLWSSFNDYISMTLLAMGGVSSLLAVFEGRNGISDPIWGYSELTKATEDEIRDAIDQTFEDGEQRLETAFDTAAETVEASANGYEERREDYQTEVSALREGVARFKADVERTVLRLKDAQKNALSRRQFVAGPNRKIDPAPLDLAVLRGLSIDETLIPDGNIAAHNSELLIGRLDAAFEDARGKLETARTAATSFITLPFI